MKDELLELFDIMSSALQLLRDVDQFVSIQQFRDAIVRVKRIMKEAVAFAEDWANPQQSVTRSTFLRDISNFSSLTSISMLDITRYLSIEDEATVAGLMKKFDVFIRQFDRGVDIQTLLNTEMTNTRIQMLGMYPGPPR